MRLCHLTKFFNSLETKTKIISLELCANRQIDINNVKKIFPAFCSVTWLDNKVVNFNEHPTILLSRKLIENNINVVIHLPGRIYNRQEMLEILMIIKNIGIRNILAVQGEKALGESKNDFPYTYKLVEFIREHFKDYFCIGVAGYPSGHPKSPSLEKDLEYLKQKVDAGASFIITQAVFDIDAFSKFYTKLEENGVNVLIIPGLFIINSYSSLMNMIKFCKLDLPDTVLLFLEENKEKKDILEEYGISKFVDTVESLFNNNNIRCVHIFTLNDICMVKEALSKLECVK